MKMSLTIKLNTIQHGRYMPKPKLHKKAFYKIFSTKTFKLKPMESINLDLQFNLKSAEGMTPTQFQLFPTLARFGLSLEESNWKTATQTESITVNILNKNYSNTFNIKKGNVLLYLLLPDTNKKIITKYEYSKSFDQM